MNIEEIFNAELIENSIEIYDSKGSLIKKIEPYAVESCMNPGTFKIEPIRVEKQKDKVILKTKKDRVEIELQKIADKVVDMSISEFVPKPQKAKGNCTKCTNCGRCSW